MCVIGLTVLLIGLWSTPMNDTVKRWRLHGHAHLWRYSGFGVRNYPGWHVTADAKACTSLLELIGLLQASPFSGRAIIPLTAPSALELSVPNASLRHTAATSFRLDYSPTTPSPDHWKLTADEGQVRLEVGSGTLAQLQQGVEDIARHKGDYCIGNDGEELWFWWHLGSAQ
jgi:hypothetical protein